MHTKLSSGNSTHMSVWERQQCATCEEQICESIVPSGVCIAHLRVLIESYIKVNLQLSLREGN